MKRMAGPEQWARARGYVRNGRVQMLCASETGCKGTVSALQSYAVSLTCSGANLIVTCGCPHMGGGQAFLRAAESDLIISGFPALEVTICPHIAALWMVWQDGKLDAGELRELSAAHLYTEAQVLLYWHEVLEEIRVIPRVALRDHQGKILRRFHPLAMDTGAGLDEDSVAIKMTGFFSQWPSWVADENGFLALRGVDGALTVLSEVVPLFPPEWTVLLDRKLEQMRPRRVVVQTAIRMDDPRNNDLLSINLRFHCERLGLSESQLEAFIRGQQMWLVDGGQYIQVENIGQLRSLLRILLYRASAADEACNDMDSSAGGGGLVGCTTNCGAACLGQSPAGRFCSHGRGIAGTSTGA